jgi:hypothetical protein
MIYHAHCEEDEKIISRLTAVQPFIHSSSSTNCVVMFANNSVYLSRVKKAELYIIQMLLYTSKHLRLN